jgi:hypothetical protein
MIPAILSCIFVIYLYRELNAVESAGGSASDAAGDRDDDLAALTSRVRSLENRLQQLVQNAPSSRGTKS